MAAAIRWILQRDTHIAEGDRTMVGVIFGHREAPHAPPSTMAHGDHWHYVATRLMAHMGVRTAAEANHLHWQWHRTAALRIRDAMCRNGNWELRSPNPRGQSGQDRSTGH